MPGPPLMAEGRVPARLLPWAGGGTRLSSRCSLIYTNPLGQERGEAGPRLGRWPHAHLSPSTLGTRLQSAGRAGKGPRQPPPQPSAGLCAQQAARRRFHVTGKLGWRRVPGQRADKRPLCAAGLPQPWRSPSASHSPARGPKGAAPPPDPRPPRWHGRWPNSVGHLPAGRWAANGVQEPPPGWLHRGALRLSERTELEQLPALLPALSEIPQMCPRHPEGWGQWGGTRWATQVKLKPAAAKHGCQPGPCPQRCQQFGVHTHTPWPQPHIPT